jgi:hypothetical protein
MIKDIRNYTIHKDPGATGHTYQIRVMELFVDRGQQTQFNDLMIALNELQSEVFMEAKVWNKEDETFIQWNGRWVDQGSRAHIEVWFTDNQDALLIKLGFEGRLVSDTSVRLALNE